MTMPERPATEGKPAGTPSRMLWVALAPPVLLFAVRAGLQWQEAQEPRAPALPLETVTTASGVFELLWPWLVALAAIVALLWGAKRLGRLGGLALVAWLLLWFGGSAALVERELNRRDLRTVSPMAARVLASRSVESSLRAAGGTRLYLQVDGLVGPRSMLSDDPRAAGLRPEDVISLDVAQGRFRGWFVTGWRPPGAASAGTR